jgi:hypothetical protein
MIDIFERLRALNQSEFTCDPAIREAADEIERLRTACDAAFMAMCAYRDNGDAELFQDAIDALGSAMLIDRP